MLGCGVHGLLRVPLHLQVRAAAAAAAMTGIMRRGTLVVVLRVVVVRWRLGAEV